MIKRNIKRFEKYKIYNEHIEKVLCIIFDYLVNNTNIKLTLHTTNEL